MFLTSLIPFFKLDLFCGSQYAMFGSIFTIGSIGCLKFCPHYETSKKKLYQTFGIIIVIFGICFMMLSDHKQIISRSLFLFLSTYIGSFFGFLIGSAIFFSELYKDNKNRF